jgi:hypothetical protein
MPKYKSEIVQVWCDFVNNVKLIIKLQRKDDVLMEFSEFKEYAIKLVTDKGFLDRLNKAWNTMLLDEEKLKDMTQEGLLMEFEAFNLLAYKCMHYDTVKPKKISEKPKRLLGCASIITGSLKDITEAFPAVRGGISLFHEMIDIFKS